MKRKSVMTVEISDDDNEQNEADMMLTVNLDSEQGVDNNMFILKHRSKYSFV